MNIGEFIWTLLVRKSIAETDSLVSWYAGLRICIVDVEGDYLRLTPLVPTLRLTIYFLDDMIELTEI